MGDDNQVVSLLEADFACAAPLGQALAGRFYYEDPDWNRENVGRFISCVGVADRRVVGFVGKYHRGVYYPPSLDSEGCQSEQVTFNIGLTDARWAEHLRSDMEWENFGYPGGDGYVAWHPAWSAPVVAHIAKSIEESQDFSGLPVLADALQDAGYDGDHLLKHLRDPDAAHVRGCWMLDRVLRKEW